MTHSKIKYFRNAGLFILALLITGLLTACGDNTPVANSLVTATLAPTTNITIVAGTNTGATTNVGAPTTAIARATTADDTNTQAIVTTTSATTTTATTDDPYPTPALRIPQVGPSQPVPQFAGSGDVTRREFYSPLLQKNEPYLIYLPPGYHTSTQRYPVLYMLHGFSGDINEWMNYGLLSRYDELINSNQIKPFIIVLPCGEQYYWVDQDNNGPKWGAYTAQEVVAHIDGNYRTIPLKESRAIGGLSMGANGALQVSMNYPNIFGVVGAHSPTMRAYDQGQGLTWWGSLAWWQAHDPVTLAKTNQYITQVKLWIDDADGDTVWRPRALELKQVLDSRGISYVWHSWPGDHSGDYWAAHVTDYLEWYNSVLDFKQ